MEVFILIFFPYIAKYVDNGCLKTNLEIKKYFNKYMINSAYFWRDFFISKTETIAREIIGKNNKMYNLGRKVKQKFL